MTQADRVYITPPTNTPANNPPGVMTRDDELGMAWWNALSERQRAKWSAIAGNTGRVKDAWKHSSEVPWIKPRLSTQRGACS